MRKMRCLLSLLAVLCLCACAPALAAGFCDDPDAVEEALKSVLMLEVYDNGELTATASGFVAFNNRTLVTNYHVVEDAEYIIAYSDIGDPYIVMDVKVMDEKRDIAILSFLSPTDLKPLSLNTSGTLKRAQRVVAVGSPLGITNTVAVGNISGVYSEDGVSMIQFTAPISEGSSGGALFDDNGDVIGVTTATLTEGQNLNLAVHVSEVADLYDTWDGTTFSINGESGGGSSSNVGSLLPQDTEESGSSSSSSPYAPSDSGSLTITEAVMLDDGTVRVSWRGGSEPYEVYYQIAENRSQSRVNGDFFHWYEEESYTGNSAVLEYMIPDHLYRIDMKDADGNTADMFFEYDSDSFRGFDAQVTFTLRQQQRGVSSTVNAYWASSIEDGVRNGNAYGMTIKVGLGERGLSRDYRVHMSVGVELPNGDVDVVDQGYTTIYKGSSEDYTYWDFFDLAVLWDDILDIYDSIPKGVYRISIYFNNQLLAVKKFQII